MKHINFDTRDMYNGKTNVRTLNDEFFEKGYSLPLWATENQYANNGFKIKENEKPVKVQFLTTEEHKEVKGCDVRYYPLYNFSQTEKLIEQAAIPQSREESSKPYWNVSE